MAQLQEVVILVVSGKKSVYSEQIHQRCYVVFLVCFVFLRYMIILNHKKLVPYAV